MQAEGIKVIDLGISVTSEQYIEAAIQEKASLIICFASMVANLPYMKTLIQAAVSAGIRKEVKIMLCGGPVTEWYSRSIGADLYAPDPVRGAELAGAC
jgi:5-methyltetrahydrofolate--homocysteine methyltransferase